VFPILRKASAGGARKPRMGLQKNGKVFAIFEVLPAKVYFCGKCEATRQNSSAAFPATF
jgi:hypothetical protein